MTEINLELIEKYRKVKAQWILIKIRKFKKNTC